MPISACGICLEDFQPGTNVTRIECGHLYCRGCCSILINRTRACPMTCDEMSIAYQDDLTSMDLVFVESTPEDDTKVVNHCIGTIVSHNAFLETELGEISARLATGGNEMTARGAAMEDVLDNSLAVLEEQSTEITTMQNARKSLSEEVEQQSVLLKELGKAQVMVREARFKLQSHVSKNFLLAASLLAAHPEATAMETSPNADHEVASGEMTSGIVPAAGTGSSKRKRDHDVSDAPHPKKLRSASQM